jgi:hypothetical protein
MRPTCSGRQCAARWWVAWRKAADLVAPGLAASWRTAELVAQRLAASRGGAGLGSQELAVSRGDADLAAQELATSRGPAELAARIPAEMAEVGRSGCGPRSAGHCRTGSLTRRSPTSGCCALPRVSSVRCTSRRPGVGPLPRDRSIKGPISRQATEVDLPRPARDRSGSAPSDKRPNWSRPAQQWERTGATLPRGRPSKGCPAETNDGPEPSRPAKDRARAAPTSKGPSQGRHAQQATELLVPGRAPDSAARP